MATIDFTSAVARRWAPGGWQPGVFHLYNKVDFSVTNGGSGDTIQCLPIPAGTLVTQVMHIVDTAEGGTSTATVGDGADPDGWIASVNNNAMAGTASLSSASGALTGATPVLTAIDGGAAGNHTVTGIATTDELIGVIHLAETTDTLDTVDDLTSEFTIDSADTIDNAGQTNTTGGFLLVAYQTPASFAGDEVFGTAGGKYYAAADTIDMVLSAHAVDTAVIKMVAVCVELDY